MKWSNLWRAIRLGFISNGIEQGLSYTEIAKLIGSTRGCVKVWTCRAGLSQSDMSEARKRDMAVRLRQVRHGIRKSMTGRLQSLEQET